MVAVSDVGYSARVALGPISSPEHLRRVLQEKASEFSGDRRIRRELRRVLRHSEASCDESVGPAFTAGGLRRTECFRFTRLLRDEVGKPKGGARHPSVFEVDVVAQPDPDKTGQWFAQAQWVVREDPNWRSAARRTARQVRKDRAWRRSVMHKPVPDGPRRGLRRTRGPAPPRGKITEDQAEWFFTQLPGLAKALDVKSVSRRDCETGEIVIGLKDGTKFPLVLGDVTEFDSDGPLQYGEGVFSSLKAWDYSVRDLNVASAAIGDAHTPEGQARMFSLAMVKALAPHVARYRGLDPDAYTDRAVAIAGFDLYHPLWPKVDKKAQLAVRAEMLAAVGRNLRRRKEALAGKADDLPENVVPHASVTEHYHGGWWQKRRPHHFDVPPTGIPLATNTKYAGIETLEEFMGMLVSRDHAQKMRYIFGAIPSLLRRCVPMHVRYQLLGASAHYTGPLRHALESRTAKFAGPGTIIGLIEANSRGLGGLLFGDRNDAAALVVDLRRSTQAGIEFIGDVLDRPAHGEQRIAGLAGDVLARGDPVRALAVQDKRSRDLHLVLAGMASVLAQLPVDERQRLLAEIWEQQRTILAGRGSLADRKPATFQTDAARPSGAPSPIRMMVTRGAADVIAASVATMFAWATGHPVDAALAWSYAVGAVVNAGLFPVQQKALAKDRDAGVVQTALAVQREADIARFAALFLLAGSKDITVPSELAEYLKDFDSSELKPWTPRLTPFLIRRLLVAPFVIGTAATPLFFKQIQALAWGNLASNATRLPVGGLSSWLFFRELVLRGREYQRVTDKADRLANFSQDVAWLREESASLTTNVKRQTRKQCTLPAIAEMREDLILRKAIGAEAAAVLQEKLAIAGNDSLIAQFAQGLKDMGVSQAVQYCRQLVPEWNGLTPTERGHRLASRYMHQYEKDVLIFGAGRLAWLNADEWLPAPFRFDELFTSEHVAPIDAGQLTLFRTICSLPCASVSDGRRLAVVLHTALLKGGSELGLVEDGAISFLTETNSPMNVADLTLLIPLVNRLVERDVELLMCGFDVEQLVDEELSAKGPRGRQRSRRAAERLLDQRLEDKEFRLEDNDYRLSYVGTKCRQLTTMRDEVAEAQERESERRKQAAEDNGIPDVELMPREPQFLMPSELGLGESHSRLEKFFGNPDSVRGLIKRWSACVGFDSPDIEAMQSLKNGLLPTTGGTDVNREEARREKRLLEQRIFGEGVFHEGLYDVVDKIMDAPDSEIVMEQLHQGTIEVVFKQAEVGTCTFRLTPRMPMRSQTSWELSLHSVDTKEELPLRLRTNNQPVRLPGEYVSQAGPAASPSQLRLPQTWAGPTRLIDRQDSKQLVVHR